VFGGGIKIAAAGRGLQAASLSHFRGAGDSATSQGTNHAEAA